MIRKSAEGVCGGTSGRISIGNGSGIWDALRRYQITRKKDGRLPGAGSTKSSSVSGQIKDVPPEKIAYVDNAALLPLKWRIAPCVVSV